MYRLVLLFLCVIISVTSADAKVYWLPDFLEDNLDRNDFRTNTTDREESGHGKCADWGMITAAEKGNKVCTLSDNIPGVGICYKGCSCPSKYQYNSTNCSGNKEPVGASCDGKYETCRCKTSLFPYTSCPAGYVPGGTTCNDGVVHYQKCVNPCDGLTDNDCGEFDCKQTYSACPSKCQVCYTDNCHIRPDNKGSYGCKKYWDDCPSKCETPYPDNCHNRADNTTDYGCEKYWDDCPSKCQIGKTCTPKDCTGYTLTTAPTDATYETCVRGCGSTTVYYKRTQCKSGYWDLKNFLCNTNQICTWKTNQRRKR